MLLSSKNSKEQVELLLAVDDTCEFHWENIQSAANRKDYTLFARSTFRYVYKLLVPSLIPVNFLQTRFSQVYYNHTKVCLESGLLRQGKTKLRYGVVQ